MKADKPVSSEFILVQLKPRCLRQRVCLNGCANVTHWCKCAIISLNVTPVANVTPLMQIWHPWCKFDTNGAYILYVASLAKMKHHCCKFDTDGANVQPLVQVYHQWCICLITFAKKALLVKILYRWFTCATLVQMCHAHWCNCDTYGKIATPEVLPAKLWNLPTICSFIEGV